MSRRAGKPLGLFGESAADVVRLPFYLGVGYRTFSVSPVRVPTFRGVLASIQASRCRELANRVLSLTSAAEIRQVLVAD